MISSVCDDDISSPIYINNYITTDIHMYLFRDTSHLVVTAMCAPVPRSLYYICSYINPLLVRRSNNIMPTLKCLRCVICNDTSCKGSLIKAFIGIVDDDGGANDCL